MIKGRRKSFHIHNRFMMPMVAVMGNRSGNMSECHEEVAAIDSGGILQVYGYALHEAMVHEYRHAHSKTGIDPTHAPETVGEV
jgi:hypothetical protein